MGNVTAFQGSSQTAATPCQTDGQLIRRLWPDPAELSHHDHWHHDELVLRLLPVSAHDTLASEICLLHSSVALLSCFSFVVFWLKAVMNDTHCLIVPNSVSGHTFYFTVWMADYVNSSKSTLHWLFFFSEEVLHLTNQALCYLGGWHTPRQIISGAVGALLIFLTFRCVHYKYSFAVLGLMMVAMISVSHLTLPKPPGVVMLPIRRLRGSHQQAFSI
jgi:hypothetical protein